MLASRRNSGCARWSCRGSRACFGRGPALRARGAPRRAVLPGGRARRMTRTAPAARRGDARGCGRDTAQRRHPLPGPELERQGRLPGRDRRRCADDLAGRFEAEHQRLDGARLETGSPVDIRALRRVTLGPERPSFSRGGTFARLRGSRDAPRGLRRGPGAARRCAPVPTSHEPTQARCWWTSSTRPSSCRRAGLPASMTRPARSSSTMSRTAGARRHDEAIAMRLLGNALATLADEMATAVFRTAHSAVVRDAMDFSAALCGPPERMSRRR